MRESTRSQLRAVLLIWAAAVLTFLVGYCATLAIFVYGLYKFVMATLADDYSSGGLDPMVIGCGLQLLIGFIFFRIRDRFEAYCWRLIVADAGTLVSNPKVDEILARQTDGDASLVAAVEARRSRRFSKRLEVLIEQAWPDRTGRRHRRGSLSSPK